MARIICVGDIHVSDKPPVNAAEDYTGHIIEMLNWINDYAATHSVDAVVWAGDVFHHKAPSRNSHALVLKMIEVVKQSKVPLLCVTGNHDITYDDLTSVHKTQPLGVLYEAGLHELDGWHPSLPLFGAPWRQDWTTNEDSAEEAFAEWRERRSHARGDSRSTTAPALAVTHAPVYPPSEAERQMFELVPTQALADAMGNTGSLYYGHIHEYHGVFEVGGVTFANMGALSRGSLTEYNLAREIKVALWEDGIFSEIPVEIAKPSSEVLRVVEATEEKTSKIDLDRFLAGVGSSTLDISSTASVVDHIRSRTDVPERVKRTAIEIVEEVAQ